MNRLRNRLIVVFLASTLIPLGATLWITTSLLERSLEYATTSQLDRVSRTLEVTAREYYRQARERLRAEAGGGEATPQLDLKVKDRTAWPEQIRDFWETEARERFFVSGERGQQLNYMVRMPGGVRVYALDLGSVGMSRISEQYRQARQTVDSMSNRDLRRGFVYTLVILSTSVWLLALVVLVTWAVRISRPIHRLTEGLTQLAEGNLNVRLPEHRHDEIGSALRAFNNTAAQLRDSRDRLVYLAQMASWQSLARKMAHEVKNSLTPIRLNMEEIVARRTDNDPEFIEQAAQIVADEVNALERRARAFSELASEPPVRPAPLDVNALIEERVAFLRRAHPDVEYQVQVSPARPRALADEDLLRGILTNLLENGAQAAAPGGQVLVSSAQGNSSVLIEVHDSGPGLSAEAKETLFEPTISFKRGGMGLGLSIVRKSALLSGGDVALIRGVLSGAAFQVRLPLAAVAGEKMTA